MTSPFTTTLSAGQVAAAAAAADASGAYVKAPYAGVVAAASVILAAAITGADTNSRTIQLHNRGQAGTGTTLVASKAFTAGQNGAADDEVALTLSATPGDLVVAAGDILEFTSLHIGATGLAAPAFVGSVDFARSTT
jgi:phage tail sheath gpL-like